MKKIKLEVEVMVDESTEYCDIIDVLEDALDEESSFYDVKLITVERV